MVQCVNGSGVVLTLPPFARWHPDAEVAGQVLRSKPREEFSRHLSHQARTCQVACRKPPSGSGMWSAWGDDRQRNVASLHR